LFQLDGVCTIKLRGGVGIKKVRKVWGMKCKVVEVQDKGLTASFS
jgi:hypothetical protein